MDCMHTNLIRLSARIQLLSDRLSYGHSSLYHAEQDTDDPLRVIFRLHHTWNTEKEAT